MAKKIYKISKEQEVLTPLELAKDIEKNRALAILKELDPDVENQWVKKGTRPAKIPANRKVLQLKG